MTGKRETGLAILCDRSGEVKEVIRDDIGVGDALQPGRQFVDVLDEGSRPKGRNFIHHILHQGAAFEWDLNLNLPDGVELFHFTGGLVYNGMVLFGATSRDEISRFYKELFVIQNEQVNLLREAVNQGSLCERSHKDHLLYEQVSRLNNQLVNAQRDLHKKNQELERINEQRNVLMGMVAHDLRTPLGVIMSYGEYLSQALEDRLGKEERDMLAAITSSSRFMHSMVEHLLDLSRVESGKLYLNLEEADLSELIGDNITLNKVLADAKGVRLSFSVGEGEHRILVDPAKVLQVVNNLVSNAIKFSPRDTEVQVSLTRSDRDQLIVVRDQGPGIPPEDQEKIFTPFLSMDTQDIDNRSTGLGLAIARRIVEGHGGRIWLESPPGGGTSFYVVLPAQPSDTRAETLAMDPREQPEEKAEEMGAPARELKILVAEDDSVNLRMMMRFIERTGHNAIGAVNGEEAVETFRSQRPDLVLMDLTMPVVDGLEAARRIRSHEQGEESAPTPIIALSGHAMDEVRDKVKAAGIDDHIVKPISLAKFKETIAEYAERRPQ
jgi:signal transduction histidine kinase/ActR/RegA family two-component response regulator